MAAKLRGAGAASPAPAPAETQKPRQSPGAGGRVAGRHLSSQACNYDQGRRLGSFRASRLSVPDFQRCGSATGTNGPPRHLLLIGVPIVSRLQPMTDGSEAVVHKMREVLKGRGAAGPRGLARNFKVRAR
eukprot:scaffold25467_cov23-Tisochrysis_lutea.AAC.1